MKSLDGLINKMITEDIIILPDANDFSSWYLTRRGEKKLTDGGLVFPDDAKERMTFLREAIKSGVLSKDDVHTKLLALPEVIGIPGLREDVAKEYADMIKESGADFDRLCSLAYAGVGTGDLTASMLGVPHVIFRKEQEARHKPTVGRFNEGDTLALLDDVMYQGDAVTRSAGKLREFNVKVKDTFVFLDRSKEGGGKDLCKKNGITVHSRIDTEYINHIIKSNPHVPQDAKDLLSSGI